MVDQAKMVRAAARRGQRFHERAGGAARPARAYIAHGTRPPGDAFGLLQCAGGGWGGRAGRARRAAGRWMNMVAWRIRGFPASGARSESGLFGSGWSVAGTEESTSSESDRETEGRRGGRDALISCAVGPNRRRRAIWSPSRDRAHHGPLPAATLRVHSFHCARPFLPLRAPSLRASLRSTWNGGSHSREMAPGDARHEREPGAGRNRDRGHACAQV